MIYVVGDIHGCFRALTALLAQLPMGESDELLFLGDYIDRGPDSRKVMDFLLAERKPHWRFLRGNHEQLLLDWQSDAYPGATTAWLINGGEKTLESYAPEEELRRARESGKPEELKKLIPKEHLEFFAGLAYFHETPEAYLCHAGVNLGKPLSRQSPSDLLWIRERFIDDPRPTPKLVVHGHTPVASVDTKRDRINLDTGCVYGGVLTAMSLPDKKLYEAREP